MAMLLCLVLLVPVVVTLVALLLQGYFTFSRVLLPLHTFDQTLLLHELSSEINSPFTPSSFHHASTISLRGVHTKYLVNIVLVADGSMVTSHQKKVVSSIRKHLVKTFTSIQIASSLTFQVRQSTQLGQHISGYTQYAQKSDNGSAEPIPYMLQSDISKYAAMPESMFQSTAAAISGCVESSGCKELTFAYYLPDFSQQSTDMDENTRSRGSTKQHFSPLRIVRNVSELIPTEPAAHATALSPASNTPSGSALLLPDKGCFLTLHLQNATHYEADDANTIYTTTANTLQCLRSLLRVPTTGITNTSTCTTDGTEGTDINPHSATSSTVVSADPALTISPADIAHYHHTYLITMLHSTLYKLDTLVRLHNYREDVLALLSMSSHQRSAYREIFDILGQIRHFGAVGSSVSSIGSNIGVCASASKESGRDDVCGNDDCLSGARHSDRSDSHSDSLITTPHGSNKLSTLLYRAYTLVVELESDPAGGLRAPPPIEQYFAIFGPYWLPVMVPVYRAVKSILVDV